MRTHRKALAACARISSIAVCLAAEATCEVSGEPRGVPRPVAFQLVPERAVVILLAVELLAMRHRHEILRRRIECLVTTKAEVSAGCRDQALGFYVDFDFRLWFVPDLGRIGQM